MWLRTEWRPGSRRAYAHCLSQCVAIGTNYDLAWFAQGAVAAGYATEEQAAVIVGPHRDAAQETIRAAIWDFSTDPVYGELELRRTQKNAALRALFTKEQWALYWGPDKSARAAVWAKIKLDPRHPAYEALPDGVTPDWSIDWPPGTPADEVGPSRREVRDFYEKHPIRFIHADGSPLFLKKEPSVRTPDVDG
jgi:hypothetical protein